MLILCAGFMSASSADASTRVLGWGDNYQYQLGVGNNDSTAAPIVMRGPDGLNSISAAEGQVMAIGPDGSAYAWGDDGVGQASGSYDDCCNSQVSRPRSLKVQADSVTAGWNYNYAVRPDGSVVQWGGYKDGFTVMESLGNVKSLAVGGAYSGPFYLALLKDGTVKAWGANQFGQLGLGNTTARVAPKAIPGLTGVKSIAAGSGNSVALMNDGSIKRWGQLVTAIPANTTKILSPTTVPGISTATQMSVSDTHVLARLSDGTVKAWGGNSRGSLGDGTETNSADPVTVTGISNATQVAAGSMHSLALLGDGTVMAWGGNDVGQLGVDGIKKSLTPVSTMAITGATAIAASSQSSFAIQDKSEPVAKLTVRIDPSSEYNEQINGSGLGYTSWTDQSYALGSTVRYFAPLDARYATFIGWSGICSGTADCVATLTGDSSLGWSYQMNPQYRTAPDTKFYSKSMDRKRRIAYFSFAASGPGKYTSGITFECRFFMLSPKKSNPKPAFANCSRGENIFSRRYLKVKTGTYSFQVRAVSRFGTDATPAKAIVKMKRPIK